MFGPVPHGVSAGEPRGHSALVRRGRGVATWGGGAALKSRSHPGLAVMGHPYGLRHKLNRLPTASLLFVIRSLPIVLDVFIPIVVVVSIGHAVTIRVFV